MKLGTKAQSAARKSDKLKVQSASLSGRNFYAFISNTHKSIYYLVVLPTRQNSAKSKRNQNNSAKELDTTQESQVFSVQSIGFLQYFVRSADFKILTIVSFFGLRMLTLK